TGSDPLDGHLITTDNPVEHIDFGFRSSRQGHMLAIHNRGLSNQRFSKHAIVKNRMGMIVFMQRIGIAFILESQMLAVEFKMDRFLGFCFVRYRKMTGCSSAPRRDHSPNASSKNTYSRQCFHQMTP